MRKPCTKCRKEFSIQNLFAYGHEKLLYCEDCLNILSESTVQCPNCSEQISGEKDSVGLVLTKGSASPEEKATAPTILVLICPRCHILFVDNFSYQLVKGLQTD